MVAEPILLSIFSKEKNKSDTFFVKEKNQPSALAVITNVGLFI